MPISKSAIEEAIRKMNTLSHQKQMDMQEHMKIQSQKEKELKMKEDEKRFLEMLQRIITEMASRPLMNDERFMIIMERMMQEIAAKPLVKGEKGDKGDRGDTPQKFVDYFTKEDVHSIAELAKPVKGRDYFDGEPASLDEMRTVAEEEVKLHEKVFDHLQLHDKKVLGELEIDESAVDGKFLFVRGKKIIGADMLKPVIQPQKHFFGASPTNPQNTYASVTASYTLDPNDGIVHVDATGGNITITLYAAIQANEGGRTRVHLIKRIDSSSNTVTIAMNGSETLEFQTTDQLPAQGSSRHIYSDSSNWFIKS